MDAAFSFPPPRLRYAHASLLKFRCKQKGLELCGQEECRADEIAGGVRLCGLWWLSYGSYLQTLPRNALFRFGTRKDGAIGHRNSLSGGV